MDNKSYDYILPKRLVLHSLCGVYFRRLTLIFDKHMTSPLPSLIGWMHVIEGKVRLKIVLNIAKYANVENTLLQTCKWRGRSSPSRSLSCDSFDLYIVLFYQGVTTPWFYEAISHVGWQRVIMTSFTRRKWRGKRNADETLGSLRKRLVQLCRRLNWFVPILVKLVLYKEYLPAHSRLFSKAKISSGY